MKIDKYTVGKRYGKSLFELALEEDKVEDIYQELLKLREVYQDVPEIGDILSDVRLEVHEKDAIFQQLASGFSGTLANFIRVVYIYKRMTEVPWMIEEYEHRYHEMHGVIFGTVTTVVPIDEQQKAKIEAKFAKQFGYKEARLNNVIDESIVGGLIIEGNDRIVDASIRSKLESLRKTLINE